MVATRGRRGERKGREVRYTWSRIMRRRAGVSARLERDSEESVIKEGERESNRGGRTREKEKKKKR